MATLRTIARTEADTIREGIAWLILWKTGRSWHAESLYLSIDDDTFEPEDLHWVRAVVEEDPNAVMVNGYYCGHLGADMNPEEIEAGLRWHYENGCNLLKNSTAFPPELGETTDTGRVQHVLPCPFYGDQEELRRRMCCIE